MEILRAEHLTKIYGKGNTSVTAVNDLSLSVAQGEFVAVVGSSGSGKSTLLHMLGGVDQPTEGKVWIQGEDIYTLSTEKLAIFRRRQIGLIYQFFNLIPTLNVEENITLPCELDGQTVDKKRLDKLVDELGLTGREKHLPEELSGGQQQRVSIGRALINRPAIVLADEPTGNLDKKNSDEIVELLRRANQEYRQTIIMITHNLEIAKTADRVIAIEDGNWGDVYKLGEGDANAGTLAFGTENNIPAPDGGLYFFDVSLKALTYKLTALGSEIYVAGLNKLEDETWTFEPLPAATTAGVFSGSITITQPSAWGFKIYLFDNNWDYVYGGNGGKLYYKGNGITDDATLAPGTYTLTVDLIHATYTIE